jgi:hypothetical protein
MQREQERPNHKSARAKEMRRLSREGWDEGREEKRSEKSEAVDDG